MRSELVQTLGAAANSDTIRLGYEAPAFMEAALDR
jgi:hypothetical protein